jgi:hypothetical protein
MKFWTVLIALYGVGDGDVESRVLFPSEAECGAALQPMQTILQASYDDVAVLCERSTLLSASPRPVARPEGLGK